LTQLYSKQTYLKEQRRRDLKRKEKTEEKKNITTLKELLNLEILESKESNLRTKEKYIHTTNENKRKRKRK